MEINTNIDERAKAFEEETGTASEQTDNFGMQMLKDMQSLSRVLASRELRRLKNKLGEDDPRVNDLKQGLKRTFYSLQDVANAQSDIAIKVPETGEGETLLQGKIKDESGKGVTGLTVVMRDKKGDELALGKTRTDATGYFAVKINSELMEKAKDTDWTFSVRREDGTEVYRHDNAIRLLPQRNLLINTVVSRDKLRPAAVSEMLKNVATDKTPTTRKPVPVDIDKLKENGYVVLGNKRSKEIHDLNNIQKGCQIDEITAANRAPFKSEENAIKKGYDYCAYCYGPDKSKR